MNVAVVDYGMGNLGSVVRALEECGARASVAKTPAELASADRVVVPGVGSFADGMAHLGRSGLDAAVKSAAGRGTPVLGICLGMQLLATEGEEGGKTPGLGLIPGRVTRMAPDGGLRVPHVGWNEVRRARPDALLEGIPDAADFYFVHSYHFAPDGRSDVAATTPYGMDFASVVGRGRVWGTQFHPEKSSKFGFELIKNFLRS